MQTRIMNWVDTIRSRAKDAGGAVSAEYVAIALLVVLMIGAVIGLNLDEKVSNCGNTVKNAMFTENANPSC